MTACLAIGDFSRATHLTVKTLRHYHETGILEPAQVDSHTGYRRYTTEQIQVAQTIRRFRDLDMPLSDIRAVLSAADVPARNELIAAHLLRLEGQLARTQSAVASLRDLLEQPKSRAQIKHRSVGTATVAAISDVTALTEVASWFAGAMGELRAVLGAQDIDATGPTGGVYSEALFARAHGAATVFVPCDATLRPVGRVVSLVLPAVEFATLIHTGSHANVDLAYGALATYVTQHALAVKGPLREYYLVDSHASPDESAWRTEICWPIFQTR